MKIMQKVLTMNPIKNSKHEQKFSRKLFINKLNNIYFLNYRTDTSLSNHHLARKITCLLYPEMTVKIRVLFLDQIYYTFHGIKRIKHSTLILAYITDEYICKHNVFLRLKFRKKRKIVVWKKNWHLH